MSKQQVMGIRHATMIRSAAVGAGCAIKSLNRLMQDHQRQHAELAHFRAGSSTQDESPETMLERQRVNSLTGLRATGDQELEISITVQQMNLAQFKVLKPSIMAAVLVAAGYWDDAGAVTIASAREAPGSSSQAGGGSEISLRFAKQTAAEVMQIGSRVKHAAFLAEFARALLENPFSRCACISVRRACGRRARSIGAGASMHARIHAQAPTVSCWVLFITGNACGCLPARVWCEAFRVTGCAGGHSSRACAVR